ncbi:MAG: DUF4292 domain-containing protein [Lishizhenia sp.]
MSQYITKALFLIGISAFLVGCSSSKIDIGKEKLPKVKTQRLINRLSELSKQKPEFFYSKISSKYEDSEYNVSFKTNVRMRKDSALNAFITFARIPIYNTMVTPDTLKMVDKRGKCYTVESVSYLKKTFGVDFEHKNIEEFLLGMPIGWNDDEKYHQINDPYNYIIASHNKRQLRKAEKDDEKAIDVYIKYYLSDDAKNLSKIIIDSPTDTTHIKVDFISRQFVDGYSVPNKAEIRVETPNDTLFIDLNYNKVTINEPKKLFLAIPDSYEQCK